ncbi:MAG: hypothetical protein PHQ22_10440 [Sulfuricurvum sp.]|nr:hypothetical protein [Sulfuricurvum sp.]
MYRWVKNLLVIAGIIAVSATSCYAQLSWKKSRYFQNWGGLNDNVASTEIADNEATDIQNVVFDTGGSIKKRYGYDTIPWASKVSTGTTVCVNGVSYYKQKDGDKYLVAVINSDTTLKFYYLPYQSGGDVSGPWIDVTSGAVTSFSNNYLPTFASCSDSLIIAVPTTLNKKPYVFTGGTIGYMDSDSDTPSCTIVCYHKNHLFTNDAANTSRIWFSALGITYDFSAIDFIDVGSDDSTKITAIVSAFEGLYIFKEKSIWRLSGYDRDSWQLTKMVDIGTPCPQSVTVADNVIYFFTSQGDIVAYNGGYDIRYISAKIGNTMDEVNYTRLPYILATTMPDKSGDVYFAFTDHTSSTNDRILVYDTTYDAWIKFSGLNANSMCTAPDGNNIDHLYFGDYSGYVHRYPSSEYNDGNILTSPIVSFYQTKWFNYPEIDRQKYLRVLKTYVLSETTSNTYLTVNMRSDYETGGDTDNILLTKVGALWDSAVWDMDIFGGQTLIINRKEVDKGKEMFQLKFGNSKNSQGFTLLGFETFVESGDAT